MPIIYLQTTVILFPVEMKLKFNPNCVTLELSFNKEPPCQCFSYCTNSSQVVHSFDSNR